MIILEKFPEIDEFYKEYWGKKPFIVRGAIDANLFESFIDGDTLAGLSLEEDIKSRLVMTSPEGGKWSCEHGPFEEERFSTLGDKNWSLLVQNVDQYHEGTRGLLESFNFSPRWLLDDIMVSYSATDGSVGPHTDSYHVFLVQGEGKREWTVADKPADNQDCIEGLDLKVLKAGVEGKPIEVSMGDVIYIPPHFAHEGITINNALTFSVGFLGPKMSELFIEYGYYLEETERHNKRYEGQDLSAETVGSIIPLAAQKTIKTDLLDTLNTDSFSDWLVQYFSPPSE